MNYKTRLGIGAVIAASGGYQIARDYKSALPEEKKKVVLKDTIMLASAMGGSYATCLIGNNTIHKVVKSGCTKEILEDLSFSIGGIIAGLAGGTVLEKLIPIKKNDINFSKLPQDLFWLSNSENLADGSAKAYTLSGSKLASRFNGAFATLAGFSIAKQKGNKNRLKASVFELLANIAIPTAAILPTVKLVEKANITGPKKAGLYMMSAAIGFLAGSSFGHYVTNRLFPKQALPNHSIQTQVPKKEFEEKAYLLSAESQIAFKRNVQESTWNDFSFDKFR